MTAALEDSGPIFRVRRRKGAKGLEAGVDLAPFLSHPLFSSVLLECGSRKCGLIQEKNAVRTLAERVEALGMAVK